MKNTKYDDDFQSYLVEGATFSGACGIPNLLDLNNASVPKRLVPFDKCRLDKAKEGYVHFYIHDNRYGAILVATKRMIPLLQQFDGVISPDPSILINQSRCLQQANVYLNRAVGYYLQIKGIPVIPNVRWGDESTYDFCFLGIPRGSLISVGTHGCMKNSVLKRAFAKGLPVMLEALNPRKIIVYGTMPDEIFSPYKNYFEFVRFPSEIEIIHKAEGGKQYGDGR